MLQLLAGKTVLISSFSNDMSAGWHLAHQFRQHGATVLLGHRSTRTKTRMLTRATELGIRLFEVDLAVPGSVIRMAEELDRRGVRLDAVFHTAAGAPKESFAAKGLADVAPEDLVAAMLNSAVSLPVLVKACKPFLLPKATITTITYNAGGRVYVKDYKAMAPAKAALEACMVSLAGDLGPEGFNVYAISPGPLYTMPAMGVAGGRDQLKELLERNPARTMLGRNATMEEVTKVGVCLASGYFSGVTAQIIYVDAGQHALGAYGMESMSDAG